MKSKATANHSIAIIGSGFGGIGLAIQLKENGYNDITIFEKAGDVGGVWRENTYPGAACDVPSHLYSFSFEPKTDWTRKFALQPEILAYLRHCVDKYGIRKHIRFRSEVVEARFDEAAGLWKIELADGTRHEAGILVAACGQLSRPAYPKIKGAGSFGGRIFHSANWDHGYSLRGKRVAVIGTGASAIQFVPEIAPLVRELDVFQRSAPYVIPKPDRVYSKLEHSVFARAPFLVAASRLQLYVEHELRYLWFAQFKSGLKLVEWAFKRFLKQEVTDPALREAMVPDYPLGCKRILISNDYLKTFNRPNVRLVTEKISYIEKTGVVTEAGDHFPADAIIYGTGFQTTDFLAPIKIRGRGNRLLNDAWRSGAEAYLGITVSGFPNLFILYGPNTNLSHNSIIYMLESQFRYILSCLDALEKNSVRYLDVKAHVQNAFNAKLQDAIRKTVWEDGCTSWYKTADGKHTNNWPGFTLAYRWKTRRVDLRDYDIAPKIHTVSV